MTMRKITRKEALKLGQRLFFTGKPCKNGHIAERITTTYRCVDCKSDWESGWRQQYPEKDREMRAREVRKNADGYKRRHNEYEDRKGKEYLYKLRKSYRDNNKAAVLENCNQRRAQKLLATPGWYDKEKCVVFYEESARLTKETGIPHQVDHIVPLINERVCGLHCDDNLQVLMAEDNLKKSNFYS